MARRALTGLAIAAGLLALMTPLGITPRVTRATTAVAGRFVRTLQAAAPQAESDSEQNSPTAPRNRTPLTFLQINDIYDLTPMDDEGGLARVATLKQRVASQGRTTLFVLSGDFLSPSVASSVFKGEQMIAALNAAGLDFATLGNHEFDFGRAVLVQRMAEAHWQWVVSNVIDASTNRPIGGAAPYVVKTIGALKVGFIGLCLTTSEISRDNLAGIRMIDPFQAAAEYLPILHQQGADVIVAITHLTFDEDRRLAERFPDIDLILGGHEHYPILVTENRTLISKTGSEGRFVGRIDVDRRPSGVVERFYDLIPITKALPDEPRTAAVISSFEQRLGTQFDTVVGNTTVPLDADTVRLRVGETNIGSLIADTVKEDVGAEIGLVNAGAIRGDRVYAAGPLTLRTLVEMLPFGNLITEVAVPGRVLLQALNNGVAKLPVTAGQFPQVSGMTLQIDAGAPIGERVQNVRVNGRPLDLDRVYTVALPDYLLKGGDNYTMFAGQRVLVSPEAGHLMLTAFENLVARRQTISPATDGRITVSRLR